MAAEWVRVEVLLLVQGIATSYQAFAVAHTTVGAAAAVEALGAAHIAVAVAAVQAVYETPRKAVEVQLPMSIPPVWDRQTSCTQEALHRSRYLQPISSLLMMAGPQLVTGSSLLQSRAVE